jgi:outer membrane protein assembly factor BamB
MKKPAKKKNTLLWLFEPLLDDPRFVQRKLFSFDAAYLDGKLYVAVSDGEEPWSGLMVCTAKEHHPALLAEFPQLTPHKVLAKWLYLSLSNTEFERVATEIVALALRRDRRLGVASSSPRVRVGKV